MANINFYQVPRRGKEEYEDFDFARKMNNITWPYPEYLPMTDDLISSDDEILYLVTGRTFSPGRNKVDIFMELH